MVNCLLTGLPSGVRWDRNPNYHFWALFLHGQHCIGGLVYIIAFKIHKSLPFGCILHWAKWIVVFSKGQHILLVLVRSLRHYCDDDHFQTLQDFCRSLQFFYLDRKDLQTGETDWVKKTFWKWKYIWPLNNPGLNCASPLVCGFFLIQNSIVNVFPCDLHNPFFPVANFVMICYVCI